MSNEPVPALLLGGQMDLCKMMVIPKSGSLYFYESPSSMYQEEKEGYVNCKQIEYRKVFVTPKGVHVFELQ